MFVVGAGHRRITALMHPALTPTTLYPLGLLLVITRSLTHTAIISLYTITLLTLNILLDQHIPSLLAIPQPLSTDIALQAVLALVLGEFEEFGFGFAAFSMEAAAAFVADERGLNATEADFAGLAASAHPLEGVVVELEGLFLGEYCEAFCVDVLVAEEAFDAGEGVEDVVAL